MPRLFSRPSGSRYLALVMSCLAILAIYHRPAEARDRPGTPSNVAVTDCGSYAFDTLPSLCVSFKNTASEKVKFDMEWAIFDRGYKQASLSPPGIHADCYPRTAEQHLCLALTAGIQSGGRKGSYIQSGGKSEGFIVKDLDWGKNYCFRFQSVNEDQVISENWSWWVCKVTQLAPPVPIAPGKPILTAIPASDGLHKMGGATPARLFIKWKGSPSPNNHFRRYLVQRYDTERKRWGDEITVNAPAEEATVDIDAKTPGLAIRVCAANISGAACSDPASFISANLGSSAPANKVSPGSVISSPRSHLILQRY